MTYTQFSLTVDIVVFRQSGDQHLILLIRRKNDPFSGKWALPGGFIDEGERTEEAAIRELREETGLSVKDAHQLHVYDDPDRDPRGRVISIAHVVMTTEPNAKGADDAEEAKWFNVEDLPVLAFDHEQIINDAIRNFLENS